MAFLSDIFGRMGRVVRGTANQGVDAMEDATFETTAPTWDTFDASHLPDHRFVALDDRGAVLGWVAAAPVSERCVYAGVVENSIYVHPAARGHGVGAALLAALVSSTM